MQNFGANCNAFRDFKRMHVKSAVNGVVYSIWRLIKLCVDGLMVPQDPAQSKQ